MMNRLMIALAITFLRLHLAWSASPEIYHDPAASVQTEDDALDELEVDSEIDFSENISE